MLTCCTGLGKEGDDETSPSQIAFFPVCDPHLLTPPDDSLVFNVATLSGGEHTLRTPSTVGTENPVENPMENASSGFGTAANLASSKEGTSTEAPKMESEKPEATLDSLEAIIPTACKSSEIQRSRGSS